MYFLTFDAENVLLGRYIQGLHVIPDDAVEVSPEQFTQTIANNQGSWTRQVDGSLILVARSVGTVDYAALIASTRYNHETAGVIVGGMSVFTDRDTQSKLTAAALRADRDPAYTIDWKLGDGTFVALTAEQIIAIADKVGDYVQACYSREAELSSALSSGTFSETELEQGWPSQEYSLP